MDDLGVLLPDLRLILLDSAGVFFASAEGSRAAASPLVILSEAKDLGGGPALTPRDAGKSRYLLVLSS